MQCKSLVSNLLSIRKLSIVLLGAAFLCQIIPTSYATTSISASQILKSEQSQDNPEAIAFLKSKDNDEKFLFFKEAFEKQKINLFNNPDQYFDPDFLLTSYVQAWSLLSQAHKEPTNLIIQKKILQFLDDHKAEYIAERLRTDWLSIMAPYWNEHNQWKNFNSQRVHLQWNRSEPNIVCWELFHRISNQKNISKSLANELLGIVNSSRYKGNSVCQKVANTLIENVPSTAFTRLVILIQQGRTSEAKEVLNTLIQKKRLPAQSARLAFNNPSRWYRTSRQKLENQNKYVRLIAAYRLTSVNIDWAISVADSLQGKLNKEEKGALWGRLGYIAAISHQTEALKSYAKGGKTVCTGPYSALPNDCIEWRARAALRVQDWKKLNTYIATMPASLATKENWLYWRGRALVETGHTEEAKQSWQKISSVRTFYGKLAAEALGKPFYYSNDKTVEATPEAIGSMDKNPGLLRAQAFYKMGLFTEGNKEWQWATRSMSAPELLAAAQWARKQLLLQYSINTAIKIAEYYPLEHDLLYPRPFEDEIKEYAKKAQIDSNWVYGLIRQESRFIAAAQSSAGANGLMQIMPATAKWIAKQLKIKDFIPETIYKGETNIHFGTVYLRSLLDRLDNKIILATTGYNAGPNRASRWQQSLPKLTEGAIFIETIPFTETRNYVQNVLTNTVEYAHGQGEEVSSFRKWIGDIDPQADTTTAEKI